MECGAKPQSGTHCCSKHLLPNAASLCKSTCFHPKSILFSAQKHTIFSPKTSCFRGKKNMVLQGLANQVVTGSAPNKATCGLVEKILTTYGRCLGGLKAAYARTSCCLHGFQMRFATKKASCPAWHALVCCAPSRNVCGSQLLCRLPVRKRRNVANFAVCNPNSHKRFWRLWQLSCSISPFLRKTTPQ